jgi:uncharacterized protein (DUF1499 family)
LVKAVFWIAIAALVAVAGGAVYFRAAPVPAAMLAADPLTATKPDSPNAWLVRPEGGDAAAPVYALSADALMDRLRDIGLAEARTTGVATPGLSDHPAQGFVARSRLFGFPDVILARAIPLTDDSATLAILSRSVHGHSDMGVNRARVERWLAALEPFEQPR